MTDATAAMIERICREICKAHGDDPDGLVGWAARGPCWQTHRSDVTATIKAISAAGLKVAGADARETRQEQILNSSEG